MTLKHIDFYDSPVMRELARQALKDGTVTPDVSSIVKAAALKKNAFAPTGNLLNDMTNLAVGLRRIGLVSKAEVLESKILAHKVSIAAFDKLLTESHPEGDVEVAESDDDYGVIETLESMHDKVLEVVNKKPTGKQAMVQDILGLAGDILKKAQKAPSPKANSQVPGQENPSSVLEDMEQSVLGGDPDKIGVINSAIPGYYKGIAESLNQGINYIDYDKWNFTGNLVFADDAALSAYGSLIKDENVVSNANNYKKLCAALLGGVFLPAELPRKVNSALANLNYDSLYAVVVKTFPAYASITTGVKGDFYNSSTANSNDNSVWSYSSKITDNIGNILGLSQAPLVKNENFKGLCDSIVKDLSSFYEASFAADKLAAASSVAKKTSESVLQPYKALLAKYSAAAPQLNPDATSAGALLNDLVKSGAVLQEYVEGGSDFQSFSSLTKDLWPDVAPVIAKSANEAISKIAEFVDFLNLNAISGKDVILDEKAVDQIVGPLTAAFRNLVTAYKSQPENSAEYKRIRNLAQITAVALNAAKGSVGQPFLNLSQQVGEAFPAKSYDELLGLVQSWQAETAPPPEFGPPTADDAGAANDGFVSTAAGLVGSFKPSGNPAPAATKAPVQSPAQGKPAANPAAGVRPDGTFSGTLPSAEKEAVKEMQALLIQMGNKLNKPELTAVGKGGAATPDGAWGSGTRAILEKAIQAMHAAGAKLNLHTGPRPGFGWGGHGQQTVTNAKQNTIVLQKFLGLSGGESEKSKQMDTKIGTIPSLNNVEMTMKDLLSLAGLYDMFKRAGATETAGVNEKTNEQYSGMPYSQFFDGMTRTWQTIKGWYDSNPKDTASYYQQINQRVKDMLNYAKRFGLTDSAGKFTPNGMVNRDQLAALEAKPAGSKETGVGYADKGTGAGQPGKPGSGGGPGVGPVGEGRDTGMGQDSPFPFIGQGDVDLKMDMYYSLPARYVGEQVLGLRVFRSRSSKQLAYALFSDGKVSSAKSAFEKFLNMLSKSLQRAVRTYAYSGASQQERVDAMNYNSQWQEAIQVLQEDLQNW